MFAKNKSNSYKNWQPQDWILAGLILVIFGFSLFMAPRVPNVVPVHWNMEGQPDGYGSKYINLFLLPGISLLILLGMSFLPLLDPFKKNYRDFSGAYSFLKEFLAVFFLIIYGVIMYGMLGGKQLDFGRIFPFVFSILLGVIGYILPGFKRNFFAGIRTPWTLVNDEVWKKTHLLGGRTFMLAALVTFISAIISAKISFIVFLVSVFIAAIVPMVYSFIIFKKIEKD